MFRVWNIINELSLDYEFRAFVCDNQLTAISQYDHYAIYPYLEGQKEKIQKLIVSTWKKVHQHILQDHYCIDFGYLKGQNKVILIEISPFRTCTGAACFHWKIDHDILYGIDPSEFRLNTKSHPQIDDLVEANWTLRWWTERDPEPYWSLYDQIMQNAEEERQAKIQEAKRTQGIMFGVELGVVAAIWYYDRFWGIVSLNMTLLSALSFHYGLFKMTGRSENGNLDLNNLECHPNERHLAEIRQLDERLNIQKFVLFVYGTLERNFHWNHKYLSRGSHFIGDAETVNKYALVMGDCNVPYVLDLDAEQKEEIGENILGELWHIDYETLIGLDEYEGVKKDSISERRLQLL